MDGRSKSITFQSLTIPTLSRPGYTSGTTDGLRTPMRCLRLFLFAFLLPCALIAVPLYMKRVILAPHVYTMTASDMREVQDGISSVWCEAQELTSETPFTSYRATGALPQQSRRQPVTIRHKLTLTDDVREFWGFYLLRGSRISVSACARWPGTTLLLVHGWKALNECVWVGQMDSVEEESSEEEEHEEEDIDEDELDPVRRQWREFLKHNRPARKGVAAVSGKPGQAEGVSQVAVKASQPEEVPQAPVQAVQPEEAPRVVEKPGQREEAPRVLVQADPNETPKESVKPSEQDETERVLVMADETPWQSVLPGQEDGTPRVEKREEVQRGFADPSQREEARRTPETAPPAVPTAETPAPTNSQTTRSQIEPSVEASETVRKLSSASERRHGSRSPTEPADEASETGWRLTSVSDDMVIGPRPTAEPIGGSLWRRLSTSDRGLIARPSVAPGDQPGGIGWRLASVADRPQSGSPIPGKTQSYAETQLFQREEEAELTEEKLRDDDEEENDTGPSALSPAEMMPFAYSDVGSMHINSRGNRTPAAGKEQSHTPLTNDVIERKVQQSTQNRRRRQVTGTELPTSTPTTELETDPLMGRMIPLTYNGHRGRVNQTMPQKETSHSEMVSSFSSSEEALLACQGVILNQPLRASAVCSSNGDSASDQLTVQVIGDDYYYLVFMSENEMLPVDVFFDVMIEKMVYDVRAADMMCRNSTSCTVPLSFWSGDSVVLEYPVGRNASEAVWSEQYTVRSTCHSRGWVVAIFIVAALFSLFVCAFC